MALSIILLIGAGVLMRSFIVLTRVDLGFNPRNVLYFRIELPHTYNTDLPGARQRISELTRRILERVSVLPGVTAVAESAEHPPLNYDWTDTIIPGKPHTERWETRYEMCSEGYFQTLGLNLLRGRFFSEDDVHGARYVMVVTQAFARQYFPNEDPIGKKVKLQVLDRPFLEVEHNIYFEIIGVSSDYKTRGYDVPGWQDFPQAFVPYSIQGFSWRTFLVRTAMDPNLLLKDIREEVRAIDPNVGIATSGTLDGALKEFYRGPQFELFTLGAFACVGMVLVVIGIFSVMAYTVRLQTHEIGIRMALGAQQGSILRFVLLNGFRLVAQGYAQEHSVATTLRDSWPAKCRVFLSLIRGLLRPLFFLKLSSDFWLACFRHDARLKSIR